VTVGAQGFFFKNAFFRKKKKNKIKKNKKNATGA
jgi:hypothetical protein